MSISIDAIAVVCDYCGKVAEDSPLIQLSEKNVRKHIFDVGKELAKKWKIGPLKSHYNAICPICQKNEIFFLQWKNEVTERRNSSQ